MFIPFSNFAYLFENPWIQVSMNMSIIVKLWKSLPMELDDFTVVGVV